MKLSESLICAATAALAGTFGRKYVIYYDVRCEIMKYILLLYIDSVMQIPEHKYLIIESVVASERALLVSSSTNCQR